MRKQLLMLAAAVAAFAALAAFSTPQHASAEVGPLPADSAVYRGVARNVYEDGGKLTMELVQADGTNYGSPSLMVDVTDNTKLYCPKGELKDGSYFEVSYGSSGMTPNPGYGKLETVEAITVSRLADASFSVYNGEIVKADTAEKTLLLKDFTYGTETLFRYNEETKIHMDESDFKAGTKLNIYFSGATTRSLPPQATALEINAYADVKIYRGTIQRADFSGGAGTLELRRASGTPYAETLTVRVLDGTRVSVNRNELKAGMYVEVLYDNTQGSFPEAYSVKAMMDAEAVVCSATFTRVEKDSTKPGAGNLYVMDTKANSEVIFHYSADTKFLTPVDSLKAGDKLSIYHRGIYTLSLPPQGIALEVSKQS